MQESIPAGWNGGKNEGKPAAIIRPDGHRRIIRPRRSQPTETGATVASVPGSALTIDRQSQRDQARHVLDEFKQYGTANHDAPCPAELERGAAARACQATTCDPEATAAS